MATMASGSALTHTVEGGGGLRLHVREWGRPDGPPILLIHGRSQNHLCWAPQYDSALADEFRLVAFDLRGHGMSEAPLDARALHRRPALGRRPGRGHRSCARTDRARRLVLRRLRHLRLPARLRPGPIAAINFVGGAVKLGEAASAR